MFRHFRITTVYLLASLFSIVPQFSRGQSSVTEHILTLGDSSDRPEAKISDVAWLAGAWAGEGFGGHVEETWNDPSAGTMIGLFKLSHDGTPSLYEIELIEEVDGSLEWKVKHFNADFSAWEEKADFVSFPLVKIGDNAAYFDGLTVVMEGDVMNVYVLVGGEDGSKENALRFERIR